MPARPARGTSRGTGICRGRYRRSVIRALTLRGQVVLALAAIAGGALGWGTLGVGKAGGADPLTATSIRIENRPEAVRVVVRFTGGPLRSTQVFLASPPRGLERGLGRLRVEKPGTRATVRMRPRRGVGVELRPAAQALIIRTTSRPHRFKYASYRVRRGPQRLAVDLWKSAPPTSRAEVDFGRRGCLVVDQVAARPGRLTVSGTVGQLFEATFVVRIRRADGRVVKRRIVTMQPGQWQESIGYRVGRRQRGTVEAVALGAKDGSLDCLSQRRVTLSPT